MTPMTMARGHGCHDHGPWTRVPFWTRAYGLWPRVVCTELQSEQVASCLQFDANKDKKCKSGITQQITNYSLTTCVVHTLV